MSCYICFICIRVLFATECIYNSLRLQFKIMLLININIYLINDPNVHLKILYAD